MMKDTLGGTSRASSAFAEQAIKSERSTIDHAHQVLEEARQLAVRCEELASRLLGATPEASAGRDGPTSPGILFALGDHAASVSSSLSDGNAALSRIERAL